MAHACGQVIENTMFMPFDIKFQVQPENVGMARLCRAILRFLVKLDKFHINLHLHGILFIVQYFPALKLKIFVKSIKLSNFMLGFGDISLL